MPSSSRRERTMTCRRPGHIDCVAHRLFATICIKSRSAVQIQIGVNLIAEIHIFLCRSRGGGIHNDIGKPPFQLNGCALNFQLPFSIPAEIQNFFTVAGQVIQTSGRTVECFLLLGVDLAQMSLADRTHIHKHRTNNAVQFMRNKNRSGQYNVYSDRTVFDGSPAAVRRALQPYRHIVKRIGQLPHFFDSRMRRHNEVPQFPTGQFLRSIPQPRQRLGNRTGQNDASTNANTEARRMIATNVIRLRASYRIVGFFKNTDIQDADDFPFTIANRLISRFIPMRHHKARSSQRCPFSTTA